jgi:ubiquinone/menaquinone biosynthesis C-methylase UbiE
MVKESELHKEARPLVRRIDLQQQFGTNDLTAWFLELVNPKSGDRVLDIGCGSGNHLLPLARICAEAIGIDASEQLVRETQERAAAQGLTNVRALNGSGDDFQLPGESFEIAFCNFAIYYMDVPAVIARMAGHLTTGGTAYVMGSPDENAKELLEIHLQATDFVPDVYAPGYSDIRKYFTHMDRHFQKVGFRRFENPVAFPSIEYFMEYYTSTNLYQTSKDATPKLAEKITEAARKVFESTGSVTITKIVDTAVLTGPKALI